MSKKIDAEYNLHKSKIPSSCCIQDYHYWREVQRKQLGDSANLYMIFASAIFGYMVNFMIENKDKNETIYIVSFTILSISVCFLVFSLIFYGWFTHNRLKDFRKTSKLTLDGYSEKKIRKKTADLGELTWNLYNYQRNTLLIGFLISIIGFCIYIYF